jgi:glycosyltransferase involved in cell wall biosynthesis
MKYTIGISTYNRAPVWRHADLWKSIINQNLDDCEIIVVDDGSDDDTLDAACDLVHDRTPPCPVRVFKCQRNLMRRTSALAQNIMFKEARGDYFISMDDDGVMAHGWFDWLRHCDHDNLLLYGEIVYVSDGTTFRDQRTKWCKPGLSILPPSLGLTWGALWCAPLAAIRAVGGHDMEMLQYRGSDCRLGFCINKLIPALFAMETPFTFVHDGLSAYRDALESRDPEKLNDYMKITCSPSLNGRFPIKRICNGGAPFFANGALSEHYKEVVNVAGCV